jgi:hypothetical protein
MKRDESRRLVEQTFKNPFSKERFEQFIRNLFPDLEPPSSAIVAGAQLPKGFEDHVVSITRLGKYRDPAGNVLDAIAVKLKNPSSLDRARTRQRNLMAHYLATRGKDAALVAFFSDESPDWRFSFVRLAFETDVSQAGRVRVKRQFTPARRYSFLVGQTEPNHTAQQQLAPLLEQESRLAVADIEAAFNIETVTNEFFERYKELFLKIKDELDGHVKQNQKVKQEFDRCQIDTVSFAKKLLGQIVFLYFIQKKGWLGVKKDAKWGEGDKYFLSNLFKERETKNYFKDILEPFFYKALALERPEDYYADLECKVPFLNGGLFEPLNGYDWKATPLNIDNGIFTDIFDIFNLYNFTVREDEPLEKEVAVDPEMLGKVFENLLEVKDRRSKGAYYTPREIVHYMCQESLIRYLDSAINKQKEVVPITDFDTLVRQGDVSLENDLAKEAGRKSGDYGLPDSVRSAAVEIDRALAELKICDPAIGSGAFPVGIMTEIVRARSALTATPSLKSKDFRTAYDFKWHCIENSLYGVDIEPSAVEIAKLRLWLSLVVDEQSYDFVRPLPNLDYKVVLGDSLQNVQEDLIHYTFYPELEKKKIQFFGSTNQRNKDVLRKEINTLLDQLTDRKQIFDFKIYFSEVFSSNNGFDIVIGNPPYVGALEFTKIYGKKYRDQLNKSYRTAKGSYDVYVLFFEKGLSITAQAGVLAFISPNKYLSANYAVALREFILSGFALLHLVDLSSIKVFEEASVYPVVSIIQRGSDSDEQVTVLVPVSRDVQSFSENSFKLINIERDMLSFLPENLWGFLLSDKVGLLKKIVRNTRLLQDLGEVQATSTASEADTYGKQIVGSPTLGAIKIVNTGTIDRWVSLWGKKELVHAGKKYLTPYLPLEKTGVSAGRQALYRSKKIVFAKIAKDCEAFIDTDGEYASINTNCFHTPGVDVSIEFIAALCNSKLFMFIYQQLFGALRMGGGYFQFQAPQLRLIPVRLPDASMNTRICKIVDEILVIRKNDPDVGTRELERGVDRLIYELYDLSSKEVALIENDVES